MNSVLVLLVIQSVQRTLLPLIFRYVVTVVKP